MNKTLKSVLIVIFSLIFGFFITNGFAETLQLYYNIPSEEFSLGFWSDIYFFRILASFVGTIVGAIIIGIHSGKKYKLYSVIYSSIIVSFWFLPLYIYYNENESFSFFSRYHIIPLLIILLTIPISYYSSIIGNENKESFERPKSILEIKWFNWLWIFPFVLNQLVSLFIFFISLIIKDQTEINGFIDMIFNFGNVENVVARIIVFLILAILCRGASCLYILLSIDEKMKLKWLQILGLVIFFNVAYLFLIKLRVLNL